jgi:hypothetical protein
MAFTYPGPNTTGLDLGLGRRKKGVDYNAEQYQLGGVNVENLFNVVQVQANQVNTTIQSIFVLPGRCKIPKLAVYCSSIEALTGHSFNIVLGATPAYTSALASAPGNDNAGVTPTYPAGGGGIASNPAVAGNTLLGLDFALTVANIPGLTAANGTGLTYAQIIVPPNPDAVWPNGGVLTLRCTTPGGGYINNLIVTACIMVETLSPTFPSSQYPAAYVPVPGIDF